MFFTVEGAIRLVFISEIFEKNHFVLEVQSQKAFFFTLSSKSQRIT